MLSIHREMVESFSPSLLPKETHHTWNVLCRLCVSRLFLSWRSVRVHRVTCRARHELQVPVSKHLLVQLLEAPKNQSLASWPGDPSWPFPQHFQADLVPGSPIFSLSSQVYFCPRLQIPLLQTPLLHSRTLINFHKSRLPLSTPGTSESHSASLPVGYQPTLPAHHKPWCLPLRNSASWKHWNFSLSCNMCTELRCGENLQVPGEGRDGESPMVSTAPNTP